MLSQDKANSLLLLKAVPPPLKRRLFLEELSREGLISNVVPGVMGAEVWLGQGTLQPDLPPLHQAAPLDLVGVEGVPYQFITLPPPPTTIHISSLTGDLTPLSKTGEKITPQP